MRLRLQPRPRMSRWPDQPVPDMAPRLVQDRSPGGRMSTFGFTFPPACVQSQVGFEQLWYDASLCGSNGGGWAAIRADSTGDLEFRGRHSVASREKT